MRLSACLAVAVLALTANAGPRKKAGAGKVTVGRAAVVVDAPPAMAKLLQSTLSAQYAVTINRDALSDAPTTKEVRTVTGPLKAIAVVLARSQGDAWTVTVLSGADGTPLDQQLFRSPARKPLKALPKDVAAALVLACATGAAPPVEGSPPPPTEPAKPEPVAATPTKKTEPAAVDAPPARTEPAEPTPEVKTTVSEPSKPSPLPAVRVGLGYRQMFRVLDWGGDPDRTLSTYSGPSAAVAFDASWFPGAPFTDGVLGNLGLSFVGDIVIGQSSRPDKSVTTRFGTRADRYRFNAAFRQPVGSVFSIEATAGYATQSFAIDAIASDGSRRPAIPAVAFSGPRGAAGVRLVKLGRVGIDAMFGFTFLTAMGELMSSTYFPRAQGFALDAGGGVSFELAANLQVRASFDWTRYFLTLRPEEGARFVATSSADSFFAGNASLVFVL